MNHQGCLLGSSLLHSLQGTHPARKDETRGNCACSWSQVSPHKECLIKDIILQSCALFTTLQMFCFGGSLLFYSGAVGTAAVQIARALGAIVVGTAGTKDGMDVVTRYSHPLLFQNIQFSFHQVRSTPRVQSQPQVLWKENGEWPRLLLILPDKTHHGILMWQVDHIGCFDVIIEHLANINLGHDVQMLKPQARWISLFTPPSPLSTSSHLIKFRNLCLSSPH